MAIDSDERTFQGAAGQLVSSFFVLLKVAMIHDMANRAVGPAIVRFRMSLEALQRAAGDSAALQFVGDGVYINRRLVRADLDVWEKACFMRDFLLKLGIAEVTFLGEVPEQSIRDFVAAVRNASVDPTLVKSVAGGDYREITFRDLDAVGSHQSDKALVVPDPIRVLRAFGVVVVTARELVGALRARERPPFLPLRRAVQEFVRLPRRTRGLQLALLALSHYRGEVAGRLARISMMVVMMGHRLSLKVPVLRELGLSAILAGAGRCLSEEHALAGAARCAEAGVFVAGGRRLVASTGASQAAALRLVLAVELGRAEGRARAHPLTRLLEVAEAYEELTASPPQGRGASPHDALKQINSDPRLDRGMARLLLATLGLFPVGSLVRLTTGETGIVCDGPAAGGLMAPRVMVVADASGKRSSGQTLSLAGTKVGIVGSVSAGDIDLNVGHFLFS